MGHQDRNEAASDAARSAAPGTTQRGHAHDHDAHDHDHDRGASSQSRLLFVACLTSTYMLAEAAGGLYSGSLTLLADAGHMALDAAALWLAWYAARRAGAGHSTQLTYGAHRFQVLVAFVNGATLLAATLWIAFEAMRRFMEPTPVLGVPMLVLAVIGMLVNLVAMYALRGDHAHDLNLQAAALHVFGDLLGSVAAIVAATVILLTGASSIDPLLSLIVAALLAHGAWRVLTRSAHILLEGAPRHLDIGQIKATLCNDVEGLEEVHHLHAWSLTQERPLITLHARLAADADTSSTLRQIKHVLAQRFGIEHSTVQIDHGSCPDERQPGFSH